MVGCAICMWQDSCICNIKMHILYMGQHPQNHRQGSVGETHCSCCLSLSVDKNSSSFHHFGSSMCMCMIIHQIHFPWSTAENSKRGRSYWHPQMPTPTCTLEARERQRDVTRMSWLVTYLIQKILLYLFL